MELCHGVAAERLATVLKTFSSSHIVLAAITPHPLHQMKPKKKVLLGIVLLFLSQFL